MMKLRILYEDIYYQTLIQEGVFDPSIFKAIFMAGGPASGKSTAANKTMKGFGLKFVNSDAAFEHLMKKAQLSLKMPPEGKEVRKFISEPVKKPIAKMWLDMELSKRRRK
jgi:cytidylate kinase